MEGGDLRYGKRKAEAVEESPSRRTCHEYFIIEDSKCALACKALTIVLQQWMIPDFGDLKHRLVSRQEELRNTIIDIAVNLIPKGDVNRRMTVATNLRQRLYLDKYQDVLKDISDPEKDFDRIVVDNLLPSTSLTMEEAGQEDYTAARHKLFKDYSLPRILNFEHQALSLATDLHDVLIDWHLTVSSWFMLQREQISKASIVVHQISSFNRWKAKSEVLDMNGLAFMLLPSLLEARPSFICEETTQLQLDTNIRTERSGKIVLRQEFIQSITQVLHNMTYELGHLPLTIDVLPKLFFSIVDPIKIITSNVKYLNALRKESLLFSPSDIGFKSTDLSSEKNGLRLPSHYSPSWHNTLSLMKYHAKCFYDEWLIETTDSLWDVHIGLCKYVAWNQDPVKRFASSAIENVATNEQRRWRRECQIYIGLSIDAVNHGDSMRRHAYQLLYEVSATKYFLQRDMQLGHTGVQIPGNSFRTLDEFEISGLQSLALIRELSNYGSIHTQSEDIDHSSSLLLLSKKDFLDAMQTEIQRGCKYYTAIISNPDGSTYAQNVNMSERCYEHAINLVGVRWRVLNDSLIRLFENGEKPNALDYNPVTARYLKLCKQSRREPAAALFESFYGTAIREVLTNELMIPYRKAEVKPIVLTQFEMGERLIEDSRCISTDMDFNLGGYVDFDDENITEDDIIASRNTDESIMIRVLCVKIMTCILRCLYEYGMVHVQERLSQLQRLYPFLEFDDMQESNELIEDMQKFTKPCLEYHELMTSVASEFVFNNKMNTPLDAAKLPVVERVSSLAKKLKLLLSLVGFQTKYTFYSSMVVDEGKVDEWALFRRVHQERLMKCNPQVHNPITEWISLDQFKQLSKFQVNVTALLESPPEQSLLNKQIEVVECCLLWLAHWLEIIVMRSEQLEQFTKYRKLLSSQQQITLETALNDSFASTFLLIENTVNDLQDVINWLGDNNSPDKKTSFSQRTLELINSFPQDRQHVHDKLSTVAENCQKAWQKVGL